MEFKRTFNTTEGGLRFIEERLSAIKAGSKEASLATILSGHALKHLIDASEGYINFTITVRKTPLFKDIRIESKGNRINLDEEGDKEKVDVYGDRMVDNEDFSEADPVALTFHKAFRDNIQYRYVRGVNRITIPIEESETKELSITFIAIFLGIIVGLIMRLTLSEESCETIDFYSFNLVKGLFMNALHLIVGPLVFFSLASCVSKYRNLAELGRMGIKTLAMYFFTTIVAILIGFSLYSAFPVGEFGMMNNSSAFSIESDEEADEEYDELMENLESSDFSIRNLISSIIPENLFTPFIETNLLGILFLALLFGIGISRSGEHGAYLDDFVSAFNHLLIAITTIITRFVPLAIFCAMAELVMFIGMSTLLQLIQYALLVIGGMFLMIIFYMLYLFIGVRLNPFIFLRKFSKAMLMGFASSSSASIMPISMQCLRKMGVDSKISSFTIPLGSNINMDGSSMVFMITVMFMAKIYGITLTPGAILSVMVAIVFLALGSPTVAGADLVIIAVLLQQIGVPLEAIGIILGIDAVFDMVQAVSNTTGDAAVSLVVAKSENMLDISQYNS